MDLDALEKISDVEWEIPASYREDMKVPVRIFATRGILEEIADDRSLEQAVNSATLPGLVGHVYVMPDMHQGYGFPIGGIAATRYPDGVVSPCLFTRARAASVIRFAQSTSGHFKT